MQGGADSAGLRIPGLPSLSVYGNGAWLVGPPCKNPAVALEGESLTPAPECASCRVVGEGSCGDVSEHWAPSDTVNNNSVTVPEVEGSTGRDMCCQPRYPAAKIVNIWKMTRQNLNEKMLGDTAGQQ